MSRRFSSAKVRSANSQSILARAEEGLVDRRAVAQIMDADLLDAVEIVAPLFVMAAHLHLVDAGLAAVDRRDAVLDPGREHEIGDGLISSALLLHLRPRLACVRRTDARDSGADCKRKPLRMICVAPLKFSAKAIKHAVAGRFHRGRLGNDPIGALIASIGRAPALSNSKMAMVSSRLRRAPFQRRFWRFANGSATRPFCLPEWSDRTRVGSRRLMSDVRSQSTILPRRLCGPAKARRLSLKSLMSAKAVPM